MLHQKYSIHEARVVEKVDNAIHRIDYYPVDSMVFLLTLIYWIVICIVDSAMQPSNN